MSQNFIYALKDPRTGEVRYIGMTTKGMARPKEHSKLARMGEKTHKANWIRQLQALDLEYEIDALEKFTNSEALLRAEVGWITHYRKSGANLTNMTDGGEGLLNPDKETRSRMAKASKGNRYGLGSGANKGRVLTVGHKAKIAASRRKQPPPMEGKKHSEETKAKIAASMEGKNRGPRSEETKAKIAVSLKRRRQWA